MEAGNIPKDAARRWVLARMLDLAPATLGLPALKHASEHVLSPLPTEQSGINYEEYSSFLFKLWKQGYDDADATLGALRSRIRALHDKVLYIRKPERTRMLQLLCAYQLRFAHIAREQGHYAALFNILRQPLRWPTKRIFQPLKLLLILDEENSSMI
ncbi:hypothetical protein EPA93_04290 [Ktedonosporobacter rubrisoli]|uniref:Uncharacterized protein n=1 Tax=Ktedonosporobacter rubrisoli TaxID=2509675 RepID=A0A4P6JJG6_KTERU|nr:hypothetical protein [Ktedonosporobacter rubrisoli]QBD75255.1 hypothetical protein EPA93_04290 [Ktedonosporobacter rubrisoli]